jgi:hypothetical protein
MQNKCKFDFFSNPSRDLEESTPLQKSITVTVKREQFIFRTLLGTCQCEDLKIFFDVMKLEEKMYKSSKCQNGPF